MVCTHFNGMQRKLRNTHIDARLCIIAEMVLEMMMQATCMQTVQMSIVQKVETSMRLRFTSDKRLDLDFQCCCRAISAGLCL